MGTVETWVGGKSEVAVKCQTGATPRKSRCQVWGGGQGMSGHAAILMVSLRDPLHG